MATVSPSQTRHRVKNIFTAVARATTRPAVYLERGRIQVLIILSAPSRRGESLRTDTAEKTAALLNSLNIGEKWRENQAVYTT